MHQRFHPSCGRGLVVWAVRRRGVGAETAKVDLPGHAEEEDDSRDERQSEVDHSAERLEDAIGW